jgi:hypothetical protein
MNNKLITTLRQAAKALEDGTFDYNWTKMQACNCGVVAACVLGVSRDGLRDMLKELPSGYTWTKFVGHSCPVTGIPEDKVLSTLIKAGLTPNDIVELEGLENIDVVKRVQASGHTFISGKKVEKFGLFKMREREVDNGYIDYEHKGNLIAYLRGWADMLVEQGRDDVAEQHESVPKSQVLVAQAV